MSEPDAVEIKEVSFFKDLIHRRVPQIIGVYIAASWGIVQFLDWIVNRYLLSPHLVDLALVILMSLIPSTLIVAYFHGKPGRDKWKKPEKIGIPANIVITAFLIFFIFGDKDLSKVSQKVYLEDETGKKIERTIPKTQFRKKIVLFYFKNETGDTSLDWLQYGITHMLEFDLIQDLFIETLTPSTMGLERADFYIYNKIKEAGYKDGIGLPLLLKKKIAKEVHVDYFLSGKISKNKEELILDTSLYDTKNAKLAAKNTIGGKEIFTLIDDMSVKLKHDLEIPNGHIQEVNDLPVAEIYTNSLSAARLCTLGENAIVLEKNWTKAQDYFEQSIRKDPTFAAALRALNVVYLFTNQTQKWVESYQPLMQHIYKLPERLQFYIKLGYYQSKQDPDKAMAVLRMIIKLFPEDLTAHSIMALFLNLRNRWDEAIKTYERMLEIDPQRYEIFQNIGAQYEAKGDFIQALNYYKKFAEHFPKNPESFHLIGGLNEKMGNHEKAKDYYEKALILKPDDIPVLTTLANIEMDLGNFDKASKQLQEALQLCKTSEDKRKVYSNLASFFRRKGQMKKTLEYVKLRNKALEEYSAPLFVLNAKIASVADYVNAGQAEEAFRSLASLESTLSPPLNKLISIGYLLLYLELEKPGEVERRLAAVQDLINMFGNEQLLFLLHYARGEIHRKRGEYAEAIKSYEASLKIVTTETDVLERIGRCYRHLKQYEKAETSIQKTLKIHPFNPRSNYEMALVYLEKGDKEKALRHLKIASEVWKDADPDYKPAQLARERLRLL